MKYFVLFLLIFFTSQAQSQFLDKKNSLSFRHAHVHPALMGGGVVVFDMNNDGWEDIFLTGGLSEDLLLLNTGNHKYEDISIELPHYPFAIESTGAMAGDIDKDGCIDLFITTYDPLIPNVLLLNDCEGGFKDISFDAGINDNGPSIGGGFFDYDLDGDLDIYVNNYIDTIRFLRDSITDGVIGYDHVPSNNFLYRNNGDNTFTEVAEELGVEGSGCTLAALPFVYNGKPSIYIANDYGAWVHPNEFFIYNIEEDVFVNRAADMGLDAAVYGMGIAAGDIGTDLDLDFYITNIGQNVFYENRSGVFHDETVKYGVENTKAWGELLSTSWGTNFLDVENDGDLDLFVSNGFIPSASFLPTSPVDSNKMYTWSGLEFDDNTVFYNLDFIGINRGVSKTDIDQDGDLDLLVATIGAEGSSDPDLFFKLFENKTERIYNFLQIELKGVESNIEGFGSTIYIYPTGNKPQMELIYSGGTHSSQNSKVAHFGLNDTESIDSLVVVWPDGKRQKMTDIPINERLLVIEGNESYGILGCTNTNSRNYNPKATINSACLTTTNVIDLDDRLDILAVFPNPAVSKTFLKVIDSNLKGRTFTVEMVNPLGKTVANYNFDKNDSHLEFDVSHLPTGMYTVVIKVPEVNGTYAKRIQVVH